ncbi:MAG: hypothetical protein SLAVMIC_00542 [uncultured marine phage]|uniref:Uncharacterized protein n=1 Tax=uncultured marine phage TaxID=707152 RepID=A0A8D9CCA0_9VIRU|nr:MAG: hypothetical protein SLAVMIC_00542 [uncultured marine phage]
MKYLNRRNDFLFDSINESMFYMSPNVRKVLTKLAEKDNEIAKELLSSELTDVKPDVTFIDLADKEGFVTFTQIKKADKLINQRFSNNDGSPSIDVVQGVNLGNQFKDLSEKPKLSKKWIDWLYQLDIVEDEASTGVFTKGRNQVKMGKIVNKIFPGKFKDKEVEEFVNYFKSTSTEDFETEKFELVEGDDIAFWYDCKNHYTASGTLGSSCMRSMEDEVFAIYTDNPDVCRLLILKDVESDKVLGRALVWKPKFGRVWDGGEFPEEVEYFMDRVYSIKDSDVNKFHDFAEKQGWARKTQNNYSSHSRVTYKGNDYGMDMEVQLDDSEYYNRFPYMDTFAEYTEWDKKLYNNEDRENGGWLLTNTNGYAEEGGEWSEYHQETIPEDEGVYSDALGTIIWHHSAVNIERGYHNHQGWWPQDHDDVYYDNREGEYLHRDDTIYSEYHGEHIFEESAVYVIMVMDEDGSVDEEDYLHENDDEFIPFGQLDDLFWYEILNDEWSWEDDYKGFLKDIMEEDYMDNLFPSVIGVTTYPVEGDEWLSYEDAILLGKKLTGGDDDHRQEDKFSYFNRIWIDSDRNVYQSIIDGKKEKDRLDRILKNEDGQIEFDDTEEYMDKVDNKFEKLSSHLDFLKVLVHQMIEYDAFNSELTEDKMKSMFDEIPSIQELNKILYDYKVEFVDKWMGMEVMSDRVKNKFKEVLDYYKDDSKFEGLTIDQIKESFKLNFTLLFPALEDKELTRSRENMTEYASEKLGREVDFEKEIRPGYLLLQKHYQDYPKRFNTANIDNRLENYKDYKFYKYAKDYQKRASRSSKYEKQFESRDLKINKYGMSKMKRFNEMFNETPPDIEVKDFMSRKWISDKKFKKLHIKNLGEILYNVYKPIGHWKKKGVKGFFGVMDLPWDDERWSILNRINTNYTALSILVNSINYVLEKGDSDISKFDLVSPTFGSTEWYEEYNRLSDFMKRNARNIFLKLTEEDGSTIINNIVTAIRRTRSIGDNAEKVVVEYLPKLNKNVTNIKLPEGSGDATDMVGGADVLFDYNGNTYTVQVKKVSYVNKRGSIYVTKGASISKHYKTNYYAILDKNYLYFFKNDPSKIQLIYGELSMEEDLLIKSFKYK